MTSFAALRTQSERPSPRLVQTDAQSFPRLFVPPSVQASRHPASWLEDNREIVRDALRGVGAVLLRGFEIEQPSTFAALATAVGGPLGDEYAGPSPRKSVAQGVYTASEVPSALVIPEHAEMSYLKQMARHLFFWCRRPARVGGGTTLVDGRRILARLEPERIAPLLQGPLRIRRRHAPPRGRRDPFELKPWSEAFGTLDRGEAAERALALGFWPHFEPSGALTLEHEQAATRVHPETGERAWLNHLLVFHASAPCAILRSAFQRERALRAAALYPVAAAYRRLLPALGVSVASDVSLHDGSAIGESTIEHIRAVTSRTATVHSWQRGDLVIVDNHLVLHGRRPFSGPRQVVVGWSAARA